ncbi:MAG TPA: hypothetical protein VIH89_06275 [Candidatus Sulfotelmatobacter sp.]
MVGVIGLVAGSLPWLDRFTPLFSPILSSRFRVFSALGVALMAVWISWVVSFAKHSVHVDGTTKRHYSYGYSYRLFAKGVIVAGVLGFALTAERIPDLFGKEVALSGFVYVDGGPNEEVHVEFLSPDRTVLNQRPSSTDQNGFYVADLVGDGGRVAYCRLTFRGCSKEQSIGKKTLALIYGGKNDQKVDFNVAFDCAAPSGGLAGEGSR